MLKQPRNTQMLPEALPWGRPECAMAAVGWGWGLQFLSYCDKLAGGYLTPDRRRV